MALEEEQSNAAQEIHSAIDCLRNCADLAGVDTPTLDLLAAGASHFSLPAGSQLFDMGSLPDGVYLLVSGRLGVGRSLNGGWESEIPGGELVGEAGWLLQEARSGAVVALRDSELLLLPNAVHRLFDRDSSALRAPAASQQSTGPLPHQGPGIGHRSQ
jgi:CRP-like cAMP-binding protein